MTNERDTITFARLEGTAGLLLWSPDGGPLSARLRSSFARGRWISTVELLLPNGSGPRPTVVEAWWLAADRAAEELAPIPLSELRRYPAATRVWVLAAKWVVEAVARQQVVPTLEATADSALWHARWRVAPVRAEDRARLTGLVDAMPGAARCWRADEVGRVLSAGAALQEFLDAAADGILRTASDATAPIPGPGVEWAVRLARALRGPTRDFPLKGHHDAHLPGSLTRWVGPATAASQSGRPMVGFRLSEPRSTGSPWVLSYHLLTSAGERVPATELAEPSAGVADVVGRMTSPQDTLLEALGRCSRVFEPIARSLNEALPTHVAVSAAEAWDLLTHVSPKLERAGYAVEVPAALSAVGRRRVRARMRVGVDGPDGAAAARGMLAGAIHYRWEACLGDDPLTAAEFRELAKAKAPLVYHRGHWVAVDPDDVQRLEALMGKGAGTMEAAEALRLALAGQITSEDGADISAEVIGDGAVQRALETLSEGAAGQVQDLEPPEVLRDVLRPYQRRGFAWLVGVTSVGFGACLADDMGLGKTVQLLGLLARIVEEGEPGRRFLVICPTSVIGNWRREITRFVPQLRPLIHHGPSRSASARNLRSRMDGDAPDEATILITSYALARRDVDMLSEIPFDCLVLDEAQNIKNPEAAQSQAVRQLAAHRRVALSGTPVENRLTELWSILDFLNPGLLGGRAAFRNNFTVPIERYGDEDAAELLRRVTGPFVLRRLKTDPEIAPDLPEKSEAVRFCPLTREQAALYQATVDKALEDIAGLEGGVTRRGRVLAMLTAIKQICNHPAHFLKDKVLAPRRSGKLTRFMQLVEEVVDSDGHALVFTQYREMGDILAAVLSKELSESIPFLHGGLSRNQREDMVQRFQSPEGPTVMVISLRAGGTGLNLTRANHVFHYDRWWNPAVEDQATDRAFRIGQTRDVTVHRMVSQGTLEEQIHQLLEDKRSLAGRVVGTDETWLSELDDDTLRSLMTLGQDAVLEEGW